MKIGVFGNCQAEGLALALQAWAPDVEVVIQSAAGLPVGDSAALDEAVARLSSCDHLLVQALEHRRPHLAPFVSRLITQADGKARRWPVLVFNGFHPDCVYITRGEAVVDGPLGAYHSAIASAAWFERLPLHRAGLLFNSYAYAALGYFDAFASALQAMQDAAHEHGFDLTASLQRQAAFMHTINHPTIDILAEVARQSLDHIELARRSEIDLPRDPLATGVVWPLYSEIADRLGLPADTGERHDLAALAMANYRALDAAGAVEGAGELSGGGPIGGPAIERARDFIRREVI